MTAWIETGGDGRKGKRHRKPRRDACGTSPRTGSFCDLQKEAQAFARHGSTPLHGFACDHDRRQVSWLAGRHLAPPSRSRCFSGKMAKGSPLTVAGAAAELDGAPSALHSLLIRSKEPSNPALGRSAGCVNSVATTAGTRLAPDVFQPHPTAPSFPYGLAPHQVA